MSPEAKDPETLWRDEAHWSGGIYFCKADRRLWVPKRIRWAGWTVNMGHPYSGAVLLALILLPVLILIAALVITEQAAEAPTKEVVALSAAGTAEETWQDSSNWKGPFYCNSDDTRVFVARVGGIRWTLNFANPGSWLWVVSVPAICLISSWVYARREKS